jgi:hypothetical protein
MLARTIQLSHSTKQTRAGACAGDILFVSHAACCLKIKYAASCCGFYIRKGLLLPLELYVTHTIMYMFIGVGVATSSFVYVLFISVHAANNIIRRLSSSCTEALIYTKNAVRVVCSVSALNFF